MDLPGNEFTSDESALNIVNWTYNIFLIHQGILSKKRGRVSTLYENHFIFKLTIIHEYCHTINVGLCGYILGLFFMKKWIIQFFNIFKGTLICKWVIKSC